MRKSKKIGPDTLPQTISTSMYSQPVFSSTCQNLDAQKQSAFTETAIDEKCQMIESYDLSQKSKCISTQQTFEKSSFQESKSDEVKVKTGIDFSHKPIGNLFGIILDH